MSKRYVTGLDIGTNKIKVLVAKRKKDGALELASRAEENSLGIRRGVVVDKEKVSEVIRKLFLKISDDVGRKINSCYVNLGGNHLFSIPSHGVVSVSRADQKISEEDLQRVLQQAKAISISSNKEIFDVIPRQFIVDDEKGIKEPIGLQGVRLEVDVLALGGFSPYIKNLSQAVLGAELDILDMIPSPIAAARAVLSERQKELGVALIDIGAGTTSLTVFEEGDLIHFAVFPIGSANITHDIAIGLKTDIEIAERIKIEYGSSILKGKNIREKIDIGEESPLVFSQKFLVKIIEDRVSEIFCEINKELKKISKEKLLPSGIVLTGGGAKMPKIAEQAKNIFHLPCRLGKPKGILELKDDMSLSTACGLILLAADGEDKEMDPGLARNFGSKIKKFFKIFIP